MSSDQQIAANRCNAQLSTGPRTPAGKAKVSVNALKHGLTGRDVVLPNESAVEFESFRMDLLADVAPVGDLEDALAEKIVIDMWRLRRVPIFEATLYRRGCQELIVQKAQEAVKKAEEAWSRYIPTEKERLAAEREASRETSRERSKRAAADLEAYDDAEKRLESAREVLESAGAALDEPSFNLMRILERRAGTFLNLWRHEIVLSRSLNKTLHELQRLQAARTGERVAAPSVVDVNVNLSDPSMPIGDADESDGTPE